MSLKRTYSAVERSEDSSAATGVEVAIQSVSPMKKSKKGNDYYVGVGSDGQKTLRFIGFDNESNQKLMSHQLQGHTVSIRNCTMKPGETEDEVFISRSSIIEQSPKKIDVKRTLFQEKKIREILQLEDGVMVHLRAKVLSAEPPRAVSKGLVQDVVLTDGSNTIEISVWEDNVNKLQALKTYKLQSLYTRTYQGNRTLTFSRNSTFQLEEDDIPIDAEEEKVEIFTDAKIVGVQNFCMYLKCIHCNNNVLFGANFNTIVRCSSCNVLQSIEDRDYEVSTNVIATDGTDSKILKLSKDIILKVLDIDDSSELAEEMESNLLRTPKMDIKYTERNSYVKDITFKKQ